MPGVLLEGQRRLQPSAATPDHGHVGIQCLNGGMPPGILARFALIAPDPRADPRVRRRGRTVNGMRVLPLSREGGSGPHAYHLTLPERWEPEPRSHGGHEWLYVLGPAEVLVLMGPHGERAHLRLSPDRC